MIFNVHFTESGITKELEFDEAPLPDDVLTIREGGIENKFWVVSVSGSIDAAKKTQPGQIRVKQLD